MEKTRQASKTREDWVRAGLAVLQERGVAGVKVVHVAQRLGVTSGSFYWHFTDLPDLLDSLLDYWEHELTDSIIVAAKAFPGTPRDRILNLMLQVIAEDAATVDQAISVWSRSDPAVREVYDRTLGKRFEFASWMFRQAGFRGREATTRGRLMVTYLMGESTSDLKTRRNWKSIIRNQFELLIQSVN